MYSSYKAKIIIITWVAGMLLPLLTMGCDQIKKEKEDPKSTMVRDSVLVEENSVDVAVSAIMLEGEKIYSRYCLVCHQADGRGVSGLNPPLTATAYVIGDKSELLAILINGSNIGLVVNGAIYSNAMPAFGNLSDEEVAQVATYIRNSFGNKALPITSDEVAIFRKSNKK